MTHKPERVLVIGIGNEFRGDDGAGIVAARLLRNQLPATVRVIEHTGEGTGLLDLLQTGDIVVLIDAAHSGAPPGAIHRWSVDAPPLSRDYLPSSSHQFGMVESLELARVLHLLPASVALYAIEGKDFDSGIGLSQCVESSVESVVQEIAEALCQSRE